jgi:hypothetical protein
MLCKNWNNCTIPYNETYQDQLQIVNSFHEMGETIAAAQFLIENTALPPKL